MIMKLSTQRTKSAATSTPRHWRLPASTFNATAERLAEHDLSRSALSLATVKVEGMFPIGDASTINPDFAKAPALVIPYHDSAGKPLTYSRDGQAMLFCRVRYLAPPGFPLPRDRKYDQPTGSGTPPYFPRCFDWQAIAHGDVDEICLVEGEKKAVALCNAGIPTVAIGGVWNFTDGATPLHPALAVMVTHCRAVRIIFDSDIATNPKIQTAEWRLAGQLALIGAQVHTVRIPGESDTSGASVKVGADDYLVNHGREALYHLILQAPALGAQHEGEIAADELSLDDILRRKVTPVEELIPGWVEKGIPNFIAGAGGVHKSRLAMQWGLCLNAGASVWGINAALNGLRHSNVTLIFCAAEDDANELARRAQAISAALKLKAPARGIFIACKGADSALVVMHENAQVDVRPFFHRLSTRLKTIPGHKVVVLDSAYDFVRFAGRAKIDEDAVNYFIKVVLQRLCDDTDSTLLIPWHPSQAGSGRDTMDGWSVAWHNAPRARLALSEVAGAEDTYELKVVKRNHGRKGPPLTLRFHEGILLPADALPDDGKATELQRICAKAAIEAAGHGVPFNRRTALPDFVFKEAEKALGRRPTRQQMRDALENAIRDRQLIYLPNTRHRLAGLYPPDEEQARDLARAAKRASRENPDA